MKRTDPIHVAVAETSVIVRSGLISVLKRLPDIPVQPVEITSMEGLHNCMQGHRPEDGSMSTNLKLHILKRLLNVCRCFVQ